MDASPIFFPGQTVTLQTHDRRTLTLTIDRPFVPFTKAVVLLARSPELGPDPVVVKIYDPRFLDERLVVTTRGPARPWSLERERAANAIWDEPFHRRLLHDDPDDPKAPEAIAAQWEKHFRMLSADSFQTECEAYARLRALQGSAIPRLLLTGTVLPSDERAMRPQAVVLEYVADAVSLGDVPVELATPELCAALVRTVDSFAGYGVLHLDGNLSNVLFAPSARPTRVVVIDFGCAGLRAEGEDDEEWRQAVACNDDSGLVRWMLKERGISAPDARNG